MPTAAESAHIANGSQKCGRTKAPTPGIVIKRRAISSLAAKSWISREISSKPFLESAQLLTQAADEQLQGTAELVLSFALRQIAFKAATPAAMTMPCSSKKERHCEINEVRWQTMRFRIPSCAALRRGSTDCATRWTIGPTGAKCSVLIKHLNRLRSATQARDERAFPVVKQLIGAMWMRIGQTTAISTPALPSLPRLSPAITDINFQNMVIRSSHARTPLCKLP